MMWRNFLTSPRWRRFVQSKSILYRYFYPLVYYSCGETLSYAKERFLLFLINYEDSSLLCFFDQLGMGKSKMNFKRIVFKK